MPRKVKPKLTVDEINNKAKKIVSVDPEKIKKIYDTWVFSRDTTSPNPNWQLVNILT